MGKNIIIGFLKDHKFSYIIGILFMFLSSYIQTLFPKMLGNTVDILKMSGFQPQAVYVNIVYILLIAAGTFACTYVWRNSVIRNGRSLECFLREKLFDQLQRLSPEFYSQRKTGDLIAYAINDINAVRQTFGPAASLAINGIVICLISVYDMAGTIDWQLTLVSLLPIPLIVFMMLYIGRIVKKRFRKVQKTFAAISDRVNENISGIRVIKAYVQEEKEVARFQKLNDQMVEANMDMVRISAYLAPAIELCFTVSFVFNLIWGGRMVLQGSISLGDFVAFNGYLTIILAPVISIGQVITVFQRGMASLARLNEIFNVEPEVKDGGPLAEFPEQCSITVNSLAFTYPGAEKEALSDISLEIPQGHTLGIIGKTGSGKSTLVSLLLKMYNVGEGKLFIGGKDINDFRLEALRSGFGFVPQDNFLFNASISENIRFFKDSYSGAEVERAARNSCIAQSILELPKGFATVLGERGVNLSGGQKQRVSIARALIKDPEILVLDDALSAVDTVTEAEILLNLRQVRKNKTTLIIASRISAVMAADEIIVLHQGRISERGTHAELLEKGGLYREIYDFQFRGENKPENQAS
ncbi:ABC transporter ATP-binding protein [Desulfosporosinus sp. PR]|uniref:ABC transporter ATP-binding protein n=1 Tax=Candidatus Desulfosporosinus nitrosoreducens TaxID=3401928 RepID=UPI0027F37DE4|nr:ABC transporter ATP-binding protein [Desulfosporosinus sp. PR]MDQ7095343.1 ABC transporter ATP-binding protein [Desulfosporosinus sp. PR]